MMARMRMSAVFIISVILFCCSIHTCKGTDCKWYAPAGGDFTLPLQTTLDANDRLKWKYNDGVVFSRRQGVSDTRTDGYVVSKDGSLTLTGVTAERKGKYEAEVHNYGGHLKHTQTFELCVEEPVKPPSIKVNCKTELVTFNCHVDQSKGVAFKWLQNNRLLPREQGGSVTRKAKDVEKDEFVCRVSNRVSNMSSKAAVQTCYQPGFFEQEFMGIDVWILVAAGAGVVVLLLIIVIICCIRTKRRRRMHVKDEEELRLGWSNPNQQHHYNHPTNQHQHHHNHNHQQQHQRQQRQQQQQPAGNTGPRPHRTKQQRQKNPDQPGNQPQPSPRRPAQAPKPADEEQPPPLPQPRKKAPKPTRA